MIGYVTLGTNDLARAEKFYDELLAEAGAKRIMTNDRMRFYGAGRGKPMFVICKPFDGQRATVGNGTMVAFAADSKEAVDRIYKKAIALSPEDAQTMNNLGLLRIQQGEYMAALYPLARATQLKPGLHLNLRLFAAAVRSTDPHRHRE